MPRGRLTDFLWVAHDPTGGGLHGTGQRFNDLWLVPGERIEIEFDKLGILRQLTPDVLDRLEPSRWGNREELKNTISSVSMCRVGHE